MTGQTTTTLADRIPAGTEPDQVADLFIDWTAEPSRWARRFSVCA